MKGPTVSNCSEENHILNNGIRSLSLMLDKNHLKIQQEFVNSLGKTLRDGSMEDNFLNSLLLVQENCIKSLPMRLNQVKIKVST